MFPDLVYARNPILDVSGCILTDDVTTNRFQIPPGTFLPARGFISFNQSELRFPLRASGNTLYLFSPTKDRVIDLIRYSGQQKEVSVGRTPDG